MTSSSIQRRNELLENALTQARQPIAHPMLWRPLVNQPPSQHPQSQQSSPMMPTSIQDVFLPTNETLASSQLSSTTHESPAVVRVGALHRAEEEDDDDDEEYHVLTQHRNDDFNVAITRNDEIFAAPGTRGGVPLVVRVTLPSSTAARRPTLMALLAGDAHNDDLDDDDDDDDEDNDNDAGTEEVIEAQRRRYEMETLPQVNRRQRRTIDIEHEGRCRTCVLKRTKLIDCSSKFCRLPSCENCIDVLGRRDPRRRHVVLCPQCTEHGIKLSDEKQIVQQQ